MDKIELKQRVDFVTRRANQLWETAFLELGFELTVVWYDLGLSWSVGKPRYVMLKAWRLNHFANRARQDRPTFELLKIACETRLRAGIPIPRPIGGVLSEYLEGNLTPPRKKSGTKTDPQWRRDFMLLAILDDLKQHDEDLPIGENRTQFGERIRKPRLAEIAERGIAASRMPNVSAEVIADTWYRRKEKYRDLMESYYCSLLNEDEVRI